jgi:hypothetical protein
LTDAWLSYQEFWLQIWGGWNKSDWTSCIFKIMMNVSLLLVCVGLRCTYLSHPWIVMFNELIIFHLTQERQVPWNNFANLRLLVEVSMEFFRVTSGIRSKSLKTWNDLQICERGEPIEPGIPCDVINK